MTYEDIIKEVEKSIKKFNKKIPASQKVMYDGIIQELHRLDLSGDTIKPTVNNLKIVASIKGKLLKLILTPQYVNEVKELAGAFNSITNLQNQYWKGVESNFKPSPLLREIKSGAIQTTVNSLTEQGIGTTIADNISKMLTTNITAGGSMKQLTNQLREQLLTTKTDGALLKYTRQITTDAVNQYSAQYTDTVATGLGFTWYAWQGSEIKTSRPFCQALVENHRYFHVSGIPNLLKGLDENGQKLIYEDNWTKEDKTVDINPTTGLPSGFIAGTNPANFLINRGGYQCGHQPRPVPEQNVKMQAPALYMSIINSVPYKNWVKAIESGKIKEPKQKVTKPPKKEPGNLPVNTEVLEKDYDFKQSMGSVSHKRLDHPTINEHEAASIHYYTTSKYHEINKYLRQRAGIQEGDTFSDPEKQFFTEVENSLSNALDKIKTKYNGVVYRGVNRLNEKQLARYVVGEEVVEPFFKSSSYDPSKAFSGEVTFKINSKNGKKIESLSNIPSEKEVLFKSGTRYKVLEKIEKYGTTFIELQEL